MVYAVIALGIITLCIATVVYVQHTVIRVLKDEINGINQVLGSNFLEVWRSINKTDKELKKSIGDLEKMTNHQLDILEKRIRKDFDTEKTQRNTY